MHVPSTFLLLLLPFVLAMHFETYSVADLKAIEMSNNGNKLKDAVRNGVVVSLDNILTDPTTSSYEMLCTLGFIQYLNQRLPGQSFVPTILEHLMVALANTLPAEHALHSVSPHILYTIGVLLDKPIPDYEAGYKRILQILYLILEFPDHNISAAAGENIGTIIINVRKFYAEGLDYFIEHPRFLMAIGEKLRGRGVFSKIVLNLFPLWDQQKSLAVLKQISKTDLLQRTIVLDILSDDTRVQMAAAATLRQISKDIIIDGKRSSLGFRLICKEDKLIQAMLTSISKPQSGSIDDVLPILLRMAKSPHFGRIYSGHTVECLFSALVHHGMTSAFADTEEARVMRTEDILSIIVHLATKLSREVIGADLHALPTVNAAVPASSKLSSCQTLSIAGIIFRLFDLPNPNMFASTLAAKVLDIMDEVEPVERPKEKSVSKPSLKLATPPLLTYIPHIPVLDAIITPPATGRIFGAGQSSDRRNNYFFDTETIYGLLPSIDELVDLQHQMEAASIWSDAYYDAVGDDLYDE